MIETVAVLLPISTNINSSNCGGNKSKKKGIRRDGSLTNMFKNLNLLSACMRICMLIYMYISLCMYKGPSPSYKCSVCFGDTASNFSTIIPFLPQTTRKQRCPVFVYAIDIHEHALAHLSFVLHAFPLLTCVKSLNIYYTMTYICMLVCIYRVLAKSVAVSHFMSHCSIHAAGKSENARIRVITVRAAPPCFQAR